jgi:polysaccharide pyruvyl transferase WcaK-like protein
MRVVISGGWGYRNLGDDAILDSTILLLKNKYPDVSIDVLTYDVADSAVHQQPQVRLHHCAHTYLDNNVCEYRYQVVNRDYSIPKKIYYKLADRVIESEWWFNSSVKRNKFLQVEEIINGADLFIMAGGGYFNEKWMAKTRAQLWELEAAKRHQVPYIIIGPTIGSFPSSLAARIKQAFFAAERISVRDDSSYEGVKKYRDDITLIPDIALSNWLSPQPVSKTIGVIFTNSSAGLQDKLVQALATAVEQHPGWQIRLFISRHWKYDFENSKRLQRKLLQAGIDAEIVFPSSFRRLEEGLSRCGLVISENLHGLILAARNLVPVIAINDYPEGSPNYKKFVAFLKQCDASERYINDEKEQHEISLIIERAMAVLESEKSKLGELRMNVKNDNLAFI